MFSFISLLKRRIATFSTHWLFLLLLYSTRAFRYLEQRVRSGTDDTLRINIRAILAADPTLNNQARQMRDVVWMSEVRCEMRAGGGDGIFKTNSEISETRSFPFSICSHSRKLVWVVHPRYV